MRRRPVLLLLIVALVASALSTVGGAAPASADSQVCVAAPKGMVCGMVLGRGGRVDAIVMARYKVHNSAVCNYRMKVTVRTPKGKVYRYREAAPRHDCSWGRAYLKKELRKTYPRGSVVAMRWLEGGKQKGRTVKIKLG